MKRKSLSYKLTIMLTVCDIVEIPNNSELIYDKTNYKDGYHYYMLTPKVKNFDFVNLIQQCKNISEFVNNWYSEVELYIKTNDGTKLF